MYHARTQTWKTPLLADSGQEKHLSFNRNRWFWGPIKHPFLKQNAIIFPLYKIKYLFCESEINCVFNIFSMCIVFFIPSNLERISKYSSKVYCMKTWMKTGRNMQNFDPFSKFCRFIHFLDFPPTFEKLSFFAKVGVSMVYVLIGSGGRVSKVGPW